MSACLNTLRCVRTSIELEVHWRKRSSVLSLGARTITTADLLRGVLLTTVVLSCSVASKFLLHLLFLDLLSAKQGLELLNHLVFLVKVVRERFNFALLGRDLVL